jgi:two-component system nitrogen regulation response regulator NtrX
MRVMESVLIGDSAPMQRLRALIEAVAPTRIPVLIEGATGTGKELVAALLHQQSRRDGALVAFNVCALGDSMFEDALFGHAKGSFTGAAGETLGFLREANGGTAFLDEISGLPMMMQAKLLRAIETGVVRPVGSSRDARSDFRTIAATNERIDELVFKGQFRADLAHRLSGMVLTVPTLAERVDDIPVLVDYFVRRARSDHSFVVTPAVMNALQERAWPGNVRELKQVVDSALAFSRERLDTDALAIVLTQRARANESMAHSTELVERQRLLRVLMSVSWDTERAASTLGVHRATIYRRMQRLGIPVPTTSMICSDGDQVQSIPSVIRSFAPIRDDSHSASANRANASV